MIRFLGMSSFNGLVSSSRSLSISGMGSKSLDIKLGARIGELPVGSTKAELLEIGRIADGTEDGGIVGSLLGSAATRSVVLQCLRPFFREIMVMALRRG